MLGRLIENITEQIVDLISKMLRELIENSKKKMSELNKMIENMHELFSK